MAELAELSRLSGLAGAVLTGVGDVLFLGRPVSGPAFDRAEGVLPAGAQVDQTWRSLWNGAVHPDRRIRAGTLVGLVGTGLLGVGLHAVGRDEPSGVPRRLATTSGVVFGVSGAGIHLFCGAVVLAYRRALAADQPLSSSGQPAPTIPLAVSTVGALSALAALSVEQTVVALRACGGAPIRTLLGTPLPWVAATLLTFGRLPAPAGGYLRPASMSTGLLLYFLRAVLLDHSRPSSPAGPAGPGR